jgi:hypothetical protein
MVQMLLAPIGLITSDPISQKLNSQKQIESLYLLAKNTLLIYFSTSHSWYIHNGA